MKIETKFNHGERVQAIIQGEQEIKETCKICDGTNYYTYKDTKFYCMACTDGIVYTYIPSKWFVPEDSYYSFTIQKIVTEFYNKNNKKYNDRKSWIYYMSDSSGTMFDENDLFKTKEEAQAECDKRNKDDNSTTN